MAQINNTNSATKLWTPANIVTLIRICLVPVFVVALISPWPEWFSLPQIANNEKSLIAAGIFVLISCTDWLDGYLARSRGEVTNFGKFMDPLADKILVTAALLALVELGTRPSWVVLIILAREFIVSGVRMMAATEGVVIAASWYGKFKTIFQMIAIVLFTIKDSHMVGSIGSAFTDVLWLVSWIVMIIALVLTIVSMMDYIVKARHLLGFGKDADNDISDKQEVGLSESEREDELTAAQYAQRVLDAAKNSGMSIGTAESLTGGLIAATLTEIPGSSAVVKGGVVSYATSIKESCLDVSSKTIEQFGVVSTQTVQEMAVGACEKLECDIAVAVSGIAGPGGAQPDKPVGTVCMAIVQKRGATRVWVDHFAGDRDEVRQQTVKAALVRLYGEISK